MRIGDSHSCPWCKQQFVIDNDNLYIERNVSNFDYAGGKLCARTTILRCPHNECRDVDVYLDLVIARYERMPSRPYEFFNPLSTWVDKDVFRTFRYPTSTESRQFDPRIPEAVCLEIREAEAIVEISPHGAAVLARRCLQLMIQEKYQVSRNSLSLQIQEIKPLVSDTEYRLMESVRFVGNSGAHPGKDLSDGVALTTPDARHILNALSTLVKKWYVDPDEYQQIVVKAESVSNKQTRRNKPTP